MSDQRTLQSGRYRLDRMIGAGGAGEVWQGFDHNLHRTVAIKTVHDGGADHWVQRTIGEARILANLDHPNIVRVHDFFVENAKPHVVMEFVSGRSVDQFSGKAPLSLPQCRDIGQAVAAALEAAHRVKVIHRDIKPPNIIIADNGVIRLVDFGAAIGPDAQRLTRTGSWLGTVPYMAPEVFEGQEPAAPADIWALGLVLHECLTGQVLFARPSASASMLAVCRDPIPSHVHFGPLGAVVDRLLQRDPAGRPTAAVVAQMLAEAEVVWTPSRRVGQPPERTSSGQAMAVQAFAGATTTTQQIAPVGSPMATAIDPRPMSTAIDTRRGSTAIQPAAASAVTPAARPTAVQSAPRPTAVELPGMPTPTRVEIPQTRVEAPPVETAQAEEGRKRPAEATPERSAVIKQMVLGSLIIVGMVVIYFAATTAAPKFGWTLAAFAVAAGVGACLICQTVTDKVWPPLVSAVVAAGLYYFISPQADGWLATLWGDQQSGMITGFSAAAFALGLMLIVELPCVPFAARALGGNGWTARGAIWIGVQVVALAGIIWWFIPAG